MKVAEEPTGGSQRPYSGGANIGNGGGAPSLFVPGSSHYASKHGQAVGQGLANLWRGAGRAGDLDSLGAAVIARLHEKFYLLALRQAAEALGDDAGLHVAQRDSELHERHEGA